MEELISGETVGLVRTESGPDRDAHGRLLRATRMAGQDIGQLLIRDGLARWVPRYADEDSRLARMYQDAEEQAREVGVGSWSVCTWP
jgi:endonuclease YncB( thermonuclease family)